MKPDNALKYINEAEVTKPKKWKEPTREELQARAEAEDREMIAQFHQRFKKN